MMSVILCGGNDEGRAGKPGGAERPSQKPGSPVGQRNGGVSFGQDGVMETPCAFTRSGLSCRARGRIRRSGGGEPGCRLFLNGDGGTAAHVVPVQPDGATGCCVAADAVGDAQRGGGRTKRANFRPVHAGQGQQDILRPAADVEAQDRPGGRQQTRNGIPADAGESSA